MQMVQIMQEQDLVNEGNINDSLGRFEEAIAAYDKALQIDPLMQMFGSIKQRTEKNGKTH
jgi:tetratricopeptide (TPR) repeat protein